MRGPAFFSLHNAFEELYTELFTAADKIAERIRAEGTLVPGGLSHLANMAGIDELAEEVVPPLTEAFEKLLKDLKAASEPARHDDRPDSGP